MKKTIYIAAIITTAFSAQSQSVGINATGAIPHSSSILDMNTGNTYSSPNGKGILPPNVPLTGITDAVTVTSPAISLLVYNTATANIGILAVVPGYYYWNGTQWVALGGSDWHTLGNLGTTAGTNFLGTTDAQNLWLKTNNKLRIRVDTNQTTIYKHLEVIDTISGHYNGGISSATYNYMPSASSPNYVRHNGIYSSKRVPTGLNDNGYSVGLWLQNFRGLNDRIASYNITDDDGGTLSDIYGLFIQTGHHHYSQTIPGEYTAITNNVKGVSVEIDKIYGTINNGYGVYIGAIGATNKWSLYSTDPSAPSYFAGNVGIGTNVPTEKLEVQGSVKIVDGTQGAGKALTSDATGKGSWQNFYHRPIPFNQNSVASAPFTINAPTAGVYVSVPGFGSITVVEEGLYKIGFDAYSFGSVIGRFYGVCSSGNWISQCFDYSYSNRRINQGEICYLMPGTYTFSFYVDVAGSIDINSYSASWYIKSL